jgi:SAM-dependent methyltransferase
MRQAEVVYWDNQFGGDSPRENIWKRQALVRKIMSLDLFHKSVCEIGVGLGIVAYVIQTAMLETVTYFGIEVSKQGVDKARNILGLNVSHADITRIPTLDKYDHVWAFDCLEHVHPDDRDQGYKEIDRILKPEGIIVLNQPAMESHHNLDYDHGWNHHDMIKLIDATGTHIELYQRYGVKVPNGRMCVYDWIILKR